MANRCVPVDVEPGIDFLQDTFYDFYQTALVIAALGFGLATGIAFLFLVCIRTPCVLRLLIWLCAAVVLVVSAGGAFFMYEKSNEEAKADGAESISSMQIKLLRGLCGVLAAFAILWLCLLVFLRSRINLAIGLIKESSHAIISMPLMYLSPIFNVLFMAIFTVVWLVFCVYLVSSGEVTTLTENGIEYKKPILNSYTRYSLIFMAFIWLWTVVFIHGASQWICAHSVISWYFSPESSKVGSMQVVRSTGVFLRYHMGTVAFGSLILALVQTLRTILMYIKSKLKNKKNVIVRMVICCCSCCLFVLAKFIQFMDKQAYIQSALNGTGFCSSARRAFGLLFRNFARVSTLSAISTFVIFVGKVGVSIVSAGLGYYYMITYMDKKLNGYTVPTIAVFVIAYMCSSIFLDIISMASDASLQVYSNDSLFVMCNSIHLTPLLCMCIYSGLPGGRRGPFERC
jgi:choline transporter-like protein 2/4/5